MQNLLRKCRITSSLTVYDINNKVNFLENCERITGLPTSGYILTTARRYTFPCRRSARIGVLLDFRISSSCPNRLKFNAGLATAPGFETNPPNSPFLRLTFLRADPRRACSRELTARGRLLSSLYRFLL